MSILELNGSFQRTARLVEQLEQQHHLISLRARLNYAWRARATSLQLKRTSSLVPRPYFSRIRPSRTTTEWIDDRVVNVSAKTAGFRSANLTKWTTRAEQHVTQRSSPRYGTLVAAKSRYGRWIRDGRRLRDGRWWVRRSRGQYRNNGSLRNRENELATAIYGRREFTFTTNNRWVRAKDWSAIRGIQ